MIGGSRRIGGLRVIMRLGACEGVAVVCGGKGRDDRYDTPARSIASVGLGLEDRDVM
jgi:hypothetical protein